MKAGNAQEVPNLDLTSATRVGEHARPAARSLHRPVRIGAHDIYYNILSSRIQVLGNAHQRLLTFRF